MDEVGCYEFCKETGEDICQKDNCFGYAGTDEVEGRRQDNDIEDVIYET